MIMRQYPDLGEAVIWDTLPGGLTVAIVPRPGFQKKLAYFVTNFGSIHTNYSINRKPYQAPDGVAHFLEHKMFDLPRGEVSAEFAALGAIPNAFTSYDMTAYYFSCTEHFEENLRLLLEFVSTPYFTEESVAKEQGIIGQEIQMTADAPEHRVFEDLMAAMYAKHNIRVPILGTKETIAQINPQVLHDCHRAFYRQDNMILCVVGDVDPQTVRQAALDILPVPPAEKVEKLTATDTDMICPQVYTTRHMEVAMPTFQLGFKSEYIPSGEESVRREMVGDLAAEALFGESSALYLKLYEQGLIDGSFGGGYESVDGMAMLTISGDSRNPEAVRDAILEEVQSLLRKGIDQKDFLRMKRSALGRRIRGLDSFDSVCFRICAYHFTGYDYMRFPAVLRSIQPEEVLKFLEHTVSAQRCALAVILPQQEV